MSGMNKPLSYGGRLLPATVKSVFAPAPRDPGQPIPDRLYCAYADSIPLIAITGQVPRSLIGKDAFQEAPVVEMAKPVTKEAYLINDINDLPRLLSEAWTRATTGKKGPILLDFPLDVQKSEIEIDLEQWLAADQTDAETAISGAPAVSSKEIDDVVGLLNDARRPFLLAGGGIIMARSRAGIV
jgi:acetolactate synthase-1/2/3 large subunit